MLFLVFYGVMKVYVFFFAVNIGVELKFRGVDVCVVYLLLVVFCFYDNVYKLDLLNFFMKFVVKFEELLMEMFCSIGRVLWYDVGVVVVGFRMFFKFFDYGFFVIFIFCFVYFMGDYKKNV